MLRRRSLIIFFILVSISGIKAFSLFHRSILNVASARKGQFLLPETKCINFASKEEQYHFSYKRNVNVDDNEDDDEGENDDEQNNKEINEESVPIILQEPSIALESGSLQMLANWNGSDVRIGIIMTRSESDIVNGLFKGLNQSLFESSVSSSHIYTTFSPSVFELPMTAKFLSASKRFDVIVCLGTLIQNEFINFKFLAQASSSGIMQVALESYTPIINGILIVPNREDAVRLSSGTENQGILWGKAAIEMGLARMSALGFDKQKKKQPSRPFSTFNVTHLDDSHVAQNSSLKVKHIKKFGF